MAKKTFVRKSRLVTGSRWYVEYYRVDSESGTEVRHRQGFDLDKIPDHQVRREVGERLSRYIDLFQPDAATNVLEAKTYSTMAMALDIALGIKISTGRKSSQKNYKTAVKYLIKWATQTSMLEQPVSKFSKLHAKQFAQYLSQAGLGGRTVNNYTSALKTLWNEIGENEGLTDNPWVCLKPVREQVKTRRAFTPEERRIVAAEVYQCHYWLFRAVLLLFYCYLRPAEMCRLRRRQFDLKTGVIRVEASQAKMWKARNITIPTCILKYFEDAKFEQMPPNNYVFGREWVPNAHHPLNPTRPQKVHASILKRLVSEGRLASTSGLSLYSWKDTGISQHARSTSPLATRDQAGHTDMKQTLQYYHTEQVISEYRDLPPDLF